MQSCHILYMYVMCMDECTCRLHYIHIAHVMMTDMYVYVYVCSIHSLECVGEEVCMDQGRRCGCVWTRGGGVDVYGPGEEVWMCMDQGRRCGCVWTRGGGEDVYGPGGHFT